MKRNDLRILISNDDGIHAPGLEVLEEIAAHLSDDVWVVAPEQDQSGAARALTLSYPLRVRKHGDKKFSVQGTPTDCVLMGVTELVKNGPPTLVLSGVNSGQNLAEHVTFSGTIAAALQGMTLGVPSIALSQSRFNREKTRWDAALAHGPGLIDKLLNQGWPSDVVINVNFPDADPTDIKDVEVTRQGQRDQLAMFAEERMDLRGKRYYWLGFKGGKSTAPEGTDLKAIYEGRISVTPLHISLTHEETHAALSKAVAGGRDKDAP